MDATRLRIYQDSLRHLADARLALITDDVESRYALDDAWDEAVIFVLRQAAWRFALKTVGLAATAGPLPGFSTAFAKPADWLRTHALFVLPGDKECPVDIREQGGKFSANQPSVSVVIRYVSSDYADPGLSGNHWPEHFAQLVAAYLAFLVAVRVTGERSAAGRMSELFSSLLPAAADLDALPEDPWLGYQLNGSFRRVAEEAARQHFWRFATVSVEVATTATAGQPGGFDRWAVIPVGWWRTRSLYVLSADGQRRPLDIREQAGLWYTDKSSFWAEYVSATVALDTTRWPAQFMRAVLLALPLARGATKSSEADATLAGFAMAAAIEADAVAPDPWLSHQLDGSFRTASEAVVTRGFWRKQMKTVQLSAQSVAPSMVGLPYRFDLPADHLQSQSLYVPFDGEEQPFNIRETAEDWSTDTPVFVARYLSTDALDAVNWPEPLAKAVLAYLGWRGEPASDAGDKAAQVRAPAYIKLLDDALRLYSMRESPWLRFQLDGSYQEAVKTVVERGRYRFATRTVVLEPNTHPTSLGPGLVSPGYTYRFMRPNDHLRTIWVHYAPSSYERVDIDFRDETDGFHTNFTPITVRYISRIALDATQWTRNFGAAVLAWLEYAEARADPEKTAVAARKLEFFKDQVATAESLDDVREVPRINTQSRFVAARYGRRWSGGPNGGSSSPTILTGTTGDAPPTDDGDELLAEP